MLRLNLAPMRSLTIILASSIFLSGCKSWLYDEMPSINCKPDESDCIQEVASTAGNSLSSQIDFWSNWQLFLFVISIIAGIITAIIVAIQKDANAYWTKPAGIIATVMVTAAATILNTLHVQNNIDKLIEIRTSLKTAFNKYEHSAKHATEADAHDKAYEFASEYTKLMDEATKLKGSAGRLDVGASSPAATISGDLHKLVGELGDMTREIREKSSQPAVESKSSTEGKKK